MTEFENVAMRDKLRDMVEAYQKVQNHMNATGALIHNVVKSEAWAAYKTTTVMEGNQVRPHDNQPNLSLRSID